MAVIRLLLAVLLTTTLIATALPAIQHTRHDTAARHARDELTTLQQQIHNLRTRTEPTPPNLPAPRRHYTLTIPNTAPGTVGVAWIAIGNLPNTTPTDTRTSDIIAYHLPGGPTHRITTHIDIQIVTGSTPWPDNKPLILQSDTRLTITYIIDDGQPRIRIYPYIYPRDRHHTPP